MSERADRAELVGGAEGPDGESTVRISEGTERVDTAPTPARPTTQIETVLEGMDLGGLHRATQMLRAEDLVPTPAPPILPDLDAALTQLEDPLPRASRASAHPRLTRLGVEPFEKPRPRERISMPAITEADAVPHAAAVETRPYPVPAEPTAIVPRYAEPTTLWMRVTRRVRAWVRRVRWARRRRAALRG